MRNKAIRNIWTIAKREFIVRALTKKFIVITLLTPLLLAIMGVVISLIMTYQSDEIHKIAVIDQKKLIQEPLYKFKNIQLENTSLTFNEIKSRMGEKYSGILILPKDSIVLGAKLKAEYYSSKSLDLESSLNLNEIISNILKTKRLAQLGINDKDITLINEKIELVQKNLENDEEIGGEIPSILGIILGFLLYFMLLLNGTLIMKSVMEEKVSRIVEVMISTVRPIELMFGKILGAGGVGIFQILIWAISILIFIGIGGSLFAPSLPNPDQIGAMSASSQQISPSTYEYIIGQMMDINWLFVVPSFLFYFLFGYFLYASLFAALGSTMGDDQGEGQSLTTIVIMPLLVSIYIAFAAMKSPNSTLAVFASIFPITSPVVMPVRLTQQPPMWEVLLSIVLLFCTTVFFAWLTAKIYRIGILLYGKKSNLKDIINWLKY